MRYGNAFIWSDIDQRKLANAIATVNHDEMEDSVIENASKYSQRKSKNFWINHPKVLEDFMVIAKRVNKEAGWNYDIDAIEPLQYTEYSSEVQGHYDWHADQHPKPYDDGRVRKISFSILLNDEYTGGGFEIETGNPNQEIRTRTIVAGKSKKQLNETTMQLPVGSGLFFQSSYFHRVLPVKTGLRKSLVGWVLGPKFK